MKKRGNSIVVTPIIVCICIIAIILIGVMLINIIKPFIMYEKLNKMANKYMFVIEKFGYLTQSEKDQLLLELDEQGFEKENITLIYPNTRKTYGQLLEFKINYKTSYNSYRFNFGKIEIVENPININVTKNSYSKI